MEWFSANPCKNDGWICFELSKGALNNIETSFPFLPFQGSLGDASADRKRLRDTLFWGHIVIAGMDLFSSWSESTLCPAGLKILTTWTVWPDPLPKITWGQMRRQRERRRSMEATVSRAPQKSLAREGLKRERGGITSYLVKVLPWLKLIDMFGANVSKVCRQGGVGGLHISRLKVEKSGKCGSQGEPSDFNDSRCLGNWSQPDSVWTSHSSAQPFF